MRNIKSCKKKKKKLTNALKSIDLGNFLQKKSNWFFGQLFIFSMKIVLNFLKIGLLTNVIMTLVNHIKKNYFLFSNKNFLKIFFN